MMSKKALFTAVLIFNLMFIVPGFAVTILVMISPATSAALQVGGIAALLALAFALIYTLKGFSKKQAWAHKLFLVLSILTELLLCLGTAAFSRPVHHVIAAISILLILVLLFGKDLGFRNSLILCVILVVANVLSLLCVILADPNIGQGGDPASNLLLNSAVVTLNLAVLMGTITFSKYVDKIKRGRKV